MRLGVVVIFATGCFAQTPVITFGQGKSAKEAQHDQVNRLTPPTLVADEEWTGQIQTARIRVWADDEFRAQNVTWQRTFDEELGNANAVLGPWFGIKLEAEYQTWQHHAPGATLDEMLTELQQQDPGTDVFAVVGLTSSLSLVSATFEQLGVGNLPGRHMIIRGYADIERIAFERAFSDIPKEEREALYVGRRRHKTTAVFLHELAHNLGAPHVLDEDTLMNAMYSDHSSGFDPASRDRIMATIDERLHREPHQRSVAASAPAAAVVKHPVLTVTVDGMGGISVDGQKLDDAGLHARLWAAADADKDTKVIVTSASGAPPDVVVKVFERAKAVGLHRFAVAAAN
jgi:hypothetical protein